MRAKIAKNNYQIVDNPKLCPQFLEVLMALGLRVNFDSNLIWRKIVQKVFGQNGDE
jgi:hypothetical protein